MKNNNYPRFTFDRIEKHPIIGVMKIYEMGKYPLPDGDGAQSSFFHNNAEKNNAKQFGIKMFNTSVEAFAAYQRQKIAAKAGLAPPVGMMVRWVIRPTEKRAVNRWGYETAIADTSSSAILKATIIGCPWLNRTYQSYAKNKRHMMWSIGSMRSFLNNMDKENAHGFYEVSSFSSHSALSQSSVYGSLRNRLMEISLVGTQYDNISDPFENEEYHWNPRLRLGEKVTEDDGMMMCNDLHSGNIGLWKGKCVAIDFGYHICCPEYIDHDNLKTMYLSQEVA